MTPYDVPHRIRASLRRRDGTALLTLASLSATMIAGADSIPIPNGSFEAPTVTFADPRIDVWVKSPKPVWYDETGGFTWDQLTGIFFNPPPGTEGHKEQTDGNQAGFLTAIPEVALFQELSPSDPAGTYQAGRTYTLTVGLVGGGGGMQPGVTLDLSLYYRTDDGATVAVASTTVTNDPAILPDRTRFRDFTLTTGAVAADAAWVGKPIGIRIASSVRPDLIGGYWDVDHVRLERAGSADALPLLGKPAFAGGRFTFEITSQPGAQLEVLSAGKTPASPQDWSSLGTVTNVAGVMVFEHADPGTGPRFYQVRSAP